MEYLRDKLKLQGDINVFTVRLDTQGVENIKMLSEYFNLRKGELIKLALSSIDIKKIKEKLLSDSEDKLRKQCEELEY